MTSEISDNTGKLTDDMYRLLNLEGGVFVVFSHNTVGKPMRCTMCPIVVTV